MLSIKKTLLFFLTACLFPVVLYAEMTVANPAALNPKLSVVGTLEADYSNDPANADNARASVKEIELGLNADIDPFAKAYVLLSKEGDEFNLEEGFVQVPVGPFDLQYKLGKFFADFGKLNRLHTHVYPFLTEPLLITHYFGERLADAGVSASGLLPLPFFSEWTLQLINDNGTSFSTGDVFPVYVGQWKNFFELTDAIGLETGLSLANGHNSTGGNTALTGFYAQLKDKLAANTYWKLHSEYLSSNYDNAGALVNTNAYFGVLSLCLNREWEFGSLGETSQSPASTGRDMRLAVFGSFSPSEFGRYRGQISQNTDTAGVKTLDVRIQYVFVLGPHAVHPY